MASLLAAAAGSSPSSAAAEVTDPPSQTPPPYDTPLTNTEASFTPAPAGAPEPAAVAEIASMRTEKSKTFSTAEPGHFVTRFYAAPIHFEDPSGLWQDIDMTLVPRDDGRLRSRANRVSVSLAPTAADAQLARVDFDADHSVAFGLQGSAPVPVHVSGTLATYASALPEVAVELRAFWGGLKEDLVLTSKAAPDMYLFPLTLRGLTARIDPDGGGVLYEDADGEVVGLTPPGVMDDSRPPHPTSTDPNMAPAGPARSQGVVYELVPYGTGQAIRMILDRTWLDAPERVYPVRVDPSNTFYANTDDTYVQTNDPDGRNDLFGDLNVGTQNAGATKWRSFIHFDTGWLRGRARGIGYTRIMTYLWGGSTCTHRPVSMHLVVDGWWGGDHRNWPGPFYIEEVARLDVNPCPNTWITWDQTGVLDMVHNWNVSQVWADNGIALKAFDENDNTIWRRFYSANSGTTPYLVTDWWGEPNTPDWISPGDAVYESPPTLHARYTHSSESTGGTLWFDVYNSGGGWLGGTPSSGRCHGCTGTHMPNGLPDGRYQWDVIAQDDANRWGPRTGRTWFTLDRRPYVPDQLSPATGTAGQSPPTLSARYDHPDPGNASGQLVFKLYDATDTFLGETYSASVCKGCTATHTPTGLADGLYKWEAVAYDGGGTGNPRAFSSSASERRTFRVDTTAPAAPAVSSSSHPDPAVWYASRTIQSSWTAPSDPTGISGYSVVVDQTAGTTPPTQVTQTATTYSTTVANDGQWYVHVRAVDGVGNWSSAADVAHFGFKADATTPGQPSITSPTHPDPNAWYADADPTFDWSGGDTASGLAGWSYALDQVPDDQPEGTFASKSYVDLSDGTHTFQVKRKNNAGTWGPPSSTDVRVDTTPPPAPTVSSSTHADEATWYANANPSVSWAANDTAPVDGYSWVLDQSSGTEPDATSEGTATSQSWTSKADGVWWLHLKARNATGTWGQTTHRAIRIDAVVETPTLASSSHPVQTTWYAVDDVLLSWSAPGHSGIAGWSWTFDGTDPDTTSEGTATTRSYPDMPDGTYPFKVRSLDGLGRWSAIASYAVRVDTSAPTISSTSSSTHPVEANWYNNPNPTVSWAASDTAPVDGYSWVLDQVSTTVPDTTSEGTGTSQSWTGKADGLWWLHLRARNETGTWTTSANTIHRAIRIDTSAPTAPPVTSSTHPVQSSWYGNNDPSVAFATTDYSGVDGYSYVLDQNAATIPDTTSEGATATKSYTDLADGTYTFHVRARNGLTMWGDTAHFTVRIDTTNGAPSVTSSTHPNPSNWYSSGAPSLEWSASYPSGVVGWSYVLDQNSGTVPDTTSEGTSTTRSYTGLANGTHWFHVRAQTGATWSQTAHFAMNVDGTPPAAPTVSSTTHPTQTVWYANANPSVSWSATDVAPVDGCSWVLDQTAGTDPDLTVDTTAFVLNFSGLADGFHQFHVRCRNAAGLWGATSHFAIRVDTTASAAPTVTSSTHPSQTSWYATDDPSFSFPASDVSGIAGYSYVFDQTPTTDPDTTSEGTASTVTYTDVVNGTWWLHVRARNGSNLWSTTTHFKVQIDDTAPGAPTVSSSTHPTQTSWYPQSDATLSFAKTDTAPVDGYSWVLDQSPSTTPDTTSEGTSGTATVTPGEGTYYFHVRARNGSNLWSTTAHFTLNTDAVTGTATISSSTHPNQNVWYPTRNVIASWTASEESGIAGYATSVTADSPGNPGTVVTTTSATAGFTVVEDRVWYLNVRAKNNAGVWGPTASFRLQVDTAAPASPSIASSTHPEATRWYSNDDPSFDFAATDSLSGVSGYSYELDHSAATTPDTTSEGSAAAKSYANVADGIWWFHVRARDNAGNWGPASHVQVRVDDTAPVAESASDTPDPVNVNNSVTFNVAWTDDPNGSPVRAIVCKTNSFSISTGCTGGDWAQGAFGTSSPRPATSDPMTTAQGDYGYAGFVCDDAGNCSSGVTGDFHVNDFPNLTSTSAEPREVISGESIEFKATWSDSGDAVRAVVCKSDRMSNSECSDGYWGRGPSSTSGESVAANPTSDADLGTQTYWFWVCDQTGLCSGPQTGEFFVQLNTDGTYAGAGASNTFTKGTGPEGYRHPCLDDTWRLNEEGYRFGASWDFRHNLLSYPANGYIGGTENLTPEQARQAIRSAINAGPGGANELRTQQECRDWGKVPGPSWTRFRDAGTTTENPAQRDNVNGAAFIDFHNPPTTTVRTCRDRMIERWERSAAVMCPVHAIRDNQTGQTLITEWAILFNVAHRNPWTINLNAPENETIIQAVATHEALHVVGVGHAISSAENSSTYCSRQEEHAAMTMYPCTPIHKADTGGYMQGGRSNYWPYTLGYGDMNGLMAAKP